MDALGLLYALQVQQTIHQLSHPSDALPGFLQIFGLLFVQITNHINHCQVTAYQFQRVEQFMAGGFKKVGVFPFQLSCMGCLTQDASTSAPAAFQLDGGKGGSEVAPLGEAQFSFGLLLGRGCQKAEEIFIFDHIAEMCSDNRFSAFSKQALTGKVYQQEETMLIHQKQGIRRAFQKRFETLATHFRLQKEVSILDGGGCLIGQGLQVCDNLIFKCLWLIVGQPKDTQLIGFPAQSESGQSFRHRQSVEFDTGATRICKQYLFSFRNEL